MEGPDSDLRRAALARRREAARRRALLVRRITGVAVAIGATALIWLLAFREEGAGRSGEPAAHGRGVSEPVAGLVREMTPAERVDQLLLLGFEGTDANAAVMDELRARQLGGILVTRRNWVDAAHGRSLVGALRAAGLAGDRLSPLIVTSQEGGEYRSLWDLPPDSRPLDIGRSQDPATAEAWAQDTAAELRGMGIDLNLAPVADVATIDSPLAGRSFSDDPVVAAEMTAATIRGCRSEGLACAPLHFPGQGAVSQDTDEGPGTVSLDPATLQQRDLSAFRAAFAEHAPAVVLSLAFFAAYDSVTPAALAPGVATGLLRDDLDYEGVALTDDLSSGAIKATTPVKNAAVAAVAAGADMVQVSSPPDQESVAEALIAAVESGEISEERLNEAAGRVLELKRALKLLRL